MICPLHDTHIDNCVHLLHDEHANWEIRVPMRASAEEIIVVAMEIQDVLRKRGRLTPVNINTQDNR